MKWQFTLGVLVLAGCQVPDTPPLEAISSENGLHGAWSLVALDPGDGSSVTAPSQPGLYLFTPGHYSAVYASRAEERVRSRVSFQPTDEEILAQYSSIIVNAGSYDVNGSELTFHPMIAKEPGFVGGRQTRLFQIDGDTLRLTGGSITGADGASPPGDVGALTLVRVE